MYVCIKVINTSSKITFTTKPYNKIITVIYFIKTKEHYIK